MKETKIERGFFDAQNAYMKMICESENKNHRNTIDDKSYKSYIVVKCNNGEEKIESGWEFDEDAKDRKNELKDDGIPSRLVSRMYLKRIGLDPSDDSNWFTGNVGLLSSTKNESFEKKSAPLRAKDIFENWDFDEYQKEYNRKRIDYQDMNK